MIKINLYCIGNLKEKYLKEMSLEFLKRLSKFAKINVFEFNELNTKYVDNYSNLNDFLEKEDKVILDNIKVNDYVILLDLHGKELDSLEFADLIKNSLSTLRGELTFIIGGTMGVSDSLRKRSNFKLKLSSLTFTHQITRVLLLEQIYRAFKINNNESYHH